MIILRIEKYRPENLPLLFAYWQKLGARIPYFFPVSEEHWEACLLADRLDGEVIFKNTEPASTNLAAQRFYEKLGFRNQGRTRSYWKHH